MSEAPSQRIVTELKVSGHLMALDAGVFCVFHAPGAQPPDAQTGLPGVRLSLPPGQASGRIAISTFRDDGWIGGSDSAALIRVDHGPAQVLVTIYQNPDGSHEAPRLQVVKLTEAPASQAEGGAAAPVSPANGSAAAAAAAGGQQPAAAGGDQPTPETAEIAAHIQGRGDVLARLDGWMGERGSKAWIEGFAIAPRHVIGSEDIEYQAVLGRGWLSPWAEGGKFCGSRGMGLPILGLSVRLKGSAAQRYDCRVQASFVDGSTASPKAGEPCQAESLAPLEAFRVEIAPRAGRGADAPKAAQFAASEVAVFQPAAAKPAPAKPAPAKSASARPGAAALVKPAAAARSKPAAPKRAAPPKSRAPAKPAALKKPASGQKAQKPASPARRAPAKPAGRGRR